MDRFSHEELQQVIHRYDSQLKKYKAAMAERDMTIKTQHASLEQLESEF